jgi:FixJ family two-component response regulator
MTSPPDPTFVPPPTVFLVDDEPGMRKALTRLLEAEGFAVRAFGTAEEFLAGYGAAALGCLVLDVAMPGIDGLELQQRLTRDGTTLSIVFLSGQGDIPMSVRAIKAGAIDFLTKPVDATALVTAVRTALATAARQFAVQEETTALRQRLSQLTPREREVLAHVIAGKLNKQIAADLGTGEHTVKVHRGRVMAKLGVQSVVELVRVAERLGVAPAVD